MKKTTIRNSLIIMGLTIILSSFTPQRTVTNFQKTENIPTTNIHNHTFNKTNKSRSTSFETSEDDALCSIKNTSFKNGEVLTYKVYYNWNFVWIAAGEVTFKVLDQGDKYYINAKGKTYRSYDYFFKVRDEFKVWIDKETMLPRTSVRKVQEGGYQLYDMMKYDFDKMEIRSFRGKTKEKSRKLVYNIDNCIHDVLSIIYYVRNKDYENMNTETNIPIRIFLDKEKYNLAATYKGKATKYIRDLGEFNTLKLMPEVISGEVFTDTSGMTIWASDDKNRIPLQIESPLSVGSVKAVLKSYQNIRYPMSSKVK